MRKVLIIANLFHASPRIPGLTNYLQDFGWRVTIISPPLGNDAEILLGFPKGFIEGTKILEAPYPGDIFWYWRKIFAHLGYRMNESITEQIKERIGETSKRSFIDIGMNWYQTIFAYPDTERTWKQPALKIAIDILNKEHFDAILSSSPFPTSHIVASKIKKRFGLPWLADFRDPWTQNHNYSFGFIRKHFETKLELQTLSGADTMTAASPEYAKKQEQLHKRPTTVITNGFELESVNNPPVRLADKFTITYTGAIYTGKQYPEKFINVVQGLISEGIIKPNDIEVRFYGPKQNWLRDIIISRGLVDVVKQYGTVSRYESWQKQRESHILLLLNWEDPKEGGVYPLKFFEYLAACRPILASGGFPKDDMKEIVVKTKAGVYATTIDEIKMSILNFYEQYKRTGSVSYNGDLKEINKYGYREIAIKFVDILNQMAG